MSQKASFLETGTNQKPKIDERPFNKKAFPPAEVIEEMQKKEELVSVEELVLPKTVKSLHGDKKKDEKKDCKSSVDCALKTIKSLSREDLLKRAQANLPIPEVTPGAILSPEEVDRALPGTPETAAFPEEDK